MKYLKKFENHTAYEEARQNLILPNVSLCVNENEVHYNPYVETRVVAKFNVTGTSNPTQITFAPLLFSEIEIDGYKTSPSETYPFSLGEHIIKYTLKDKTTIGSWAFTSCKFITLVTIPSNIISIGSYVFNECTSLLSITIPNSVTSIDSNAFGGCTSLTSITIEATTPPTLGNDVFANNASERKFYVPAESVDTYKAASGWSTYAADIEAIP